ncbi:MAG TPA: DUF4345 domain-containing protein [Herpetosiphonaceae bacterium]
MNTISMRALRIVLIGAGAFIVFLGIDFGFGGFRTLGWQGSGSTDFVQISDAARFGVQDSHFRFFGGAFGALGLWMIFAARDPRRYRQSLLLIFAAIAAGGLTRFTAGDRSLLFGRELGVALLVELGLSAVLAGWLARAGAAPADGAPASG